MMKLANKCCLTAALLLMYTLPALADCTYPKKPNDPPSGAAATKDEMIAAKKITAQYTVDVTAYLDCLDAEAQATIGSMGAAAKPEAIDQVKQKHDLKMNAAQEGLQKYQEAFNVELRAFKAKP